MPVAQAPTPLEIAAWHEYLNVCRLAGVRYELVEPWAWEQLQAALLDIRMKGRKR